MFRLKIIDKQAEHLEAEIDTKVNPLPCQPKHIDPIHIRAVIVCTAHQIRAIPNNHPRCPHSIQIIYADVMAQRIALDAEYTCLAHSTRRNVGALGTIVVKERVQSSSIHEQVVATKDTETPAIRIVRGYRSVGASGGGKGRIR